MPTKKPTKKRACKECQRKIIDQSKAQLCWQCSRRVYELYSALQAEYRKDSKLWREEEVKLHARAESAEKHNAILLAEREARDKREVTCDVCGADTGGEINSNYCDECWDRELHQSLRQRFKAWAAKWSIEIACALTILAVFAGASWYALRWGK